MREDGICMRYLVYCGSGIGDNILILPMARMIRKNDPKAVIHAFCRSDKNLIGISEEILSLQQDIEKLNYYSAYEVVHSIRFLAGAVRQRYDFGIVMQYTDNRDTSTWPYRIVKIAARKTCGTAHTFHKSVSYDFRVALKPGESVLEMSSRLLNAMGMETRRDWNQEPLLSSERLESRLASMGVCRDSSLKTVALVLGAGAIRGRDYKVWPLQNWLALSKALADAHYRVILLGGNKEAGQIGESDITRKGVLNFVGKCGVSQSLALLSVCDLAIGADTGLMHCAGALGLPSLSLFGPTNPAEYLPFGGKAQYIASNEPCAPCFKTEAMFRCKDFVCMRRITPQMVYDRAADMLKQ